MSSLAKNTPMITVANSGAEEPAAMKVAPATSGDSLNSKKKIIIKSSYRRSLNLTNLNISLIYIGI